MSKQCCKRIGKWITFFISWKISCQVLQASYHFEAFVLQNKNKQFQFGEKGSFDMMGHLRVLGMKSFSGYSHLHRQFVVNGNTVMYSMKQIELYKRMHTVLSGQVKNGHSLNQLYTYSVSLSSDSDVSMRTWRKHADTDFKCVHTLVFVCAGAGVSLRPKKIDSLSQHLLPNKLCVVSFLLLLIFLPK